MHVGAALGGDAGLLGLLRLGVLPRLLRQHVLDVVDRARGLADLVVALGAGDVDGVALGEPLQQADGTTGWILTTKVPLRNPEGQIIGLVGRGQDITERKHAEAERQQLQEDLIQALCLSFTVSTLALAVNVAAAGGLTISMAAMPLAALAAAFVGMWVCQVVRLRLSPAAFRHWFFAGVLVLGVYLVARSFV